MRPGNCSGSYSAPPRTRAIALRSSSPPREVDATTFSMRYLVTEGPPGAGLAVGGAVGRCGTPLVPYIVRSPPQTPAGRTTGPASCLEALHAAVRLRPPEEAQERLGLRPRQRDHVPAPVRVS